MDNWDLGFILRIGEYVATRGIPVTDPFSFPGEGQPWALEQWLGPLLFWKTYAIAGISGVIVMKAAVCALAVFFAFLAARAASGNVLAASVGALLCASAGAVRFNAQPNVLTTLGVAVTAWALHRARETRSLRPVAWLPLLYGVWVHTHPGYLSGLVLLGAFSAGAIVPLGERAFTPRQAVILGALTLGCAGAAVLSLAIFHPLHLQPLDRVFAIFSSPVSRANIIEYAPLGSSYALNGPVLLLLAAPPLGWVLARKPLPLPVVVTWAAFAIGELRVGRLVAEASIVLAPAFAQAVTAAAGSLRERGAVRAFPAALGWLAPVAGALGAAAHLASAQARPLDWPPWFYQRDCYAFIDAHQLPPRAFNDLWLGGSFIFHFDGKRKTFIDGRSFYSDRFFTEDYLPIRDARPGWEDVVRRWNIEWFLLVPGRFQRLHDALRRSGRRVLYEDPYCAIYGG